tara:strand:+ start:749 stop:1006 length:258 start_codon:yes stop_codon:yes gene_type:complete
MRVRVKFSGRFIMGDKMPGKHYTRIVFSDELILESENDTKRYYIEDRSNCVNGVVRQFEITEEEFRRIEKILVDCNDKGEVIEKF